MCSSDLLPFGRRLEYGMTKRAIPVERKKENKNATFMPGHFKMSIAISKPAALPRELLKKH